MDIAGKKVLVFGAGLSGEAASALLLCLQADVLLYDGNAGLDAEKIRTEIEKKAADICQKQECKRARAEDAMQTAEKTQTADSTSEKDGGQAADNLAAASETRTEKGMQGERGVPAAGGTLKIRLGDLDEEMRQEIIRSLSLAVLSPGVPTDLPFVGEMKAAGIPIWGEVELAYVYGHGDVLAVTGTNGKTTTTTLLGEILRAYNPETYVVGNIGNPYTLTALAASPCAVTAAEMSSFQLETIQSFRPKVSAILNITPDHLNRHHTMEAYIAAKKRIAKNQTGKDFCVLNYEDAVTRAFGEETGASVLYFSSARTLDRGIWLEDGRMVLSLEEGKQEILCHVDELQILGTHNHENAMAAALMAAAYGVPSEVISAVLKAFQGVEHRIEFVAEKNGVAYYNDSKGTNPDAAIKGIQAMKRPTVLIGGGYDKDSSYDEWIQAFDGKVKKLILIGQTKEKIAAAAASLGFTDTVLADTFEEAFAKCVEYAAPGDAVLLSPACASWGMFKNYEVRGRLFKDLVKALPEA